MLLSNVKLQKYEVAVTVTHVTKIKFHKEY